ncbi:MAG: transposase [Anaerolineales bacterium]|jgi:REP element-mobilizing transposase RayT
MPRRKLEFVQGEIYHLFNRGVDKSSIFVTSENYFFFITKCWEYSRSLEIPILAYCLMPNHYHLVVYQSGDEPAGKLVQLVCNSYSKAFNSLMNRTGTLFQGRYRAKHVTSQSYLERVCAYVHANPVVAGLVPEPEYWPYSDFTRWMGMGIEGSSMRIHRELGVILGQDYRHILEEVLAI